MKDIEKQIEEIAKNLNVVAAFFQSREMQRTIIRKLLDEKLPAIKQRLDAIEKATTDVEEEETDNRWPSILNQR